MKATPRYLIAALLAGASIAATAASPNQSKTSVAPSKDPALQAETDYKLARDACAAKQDPERKACLKEAMDAHDRAINAAKGTRGTNDTPTDTAR